MTETSPDLMLQLGSPEDAIALGRALGEALTMLLAEQAKQPEAACPRLPSVYLWGELGLGKTTLSRGFVEAIPGGDRAEISSPSFTLCNIYPTTPPVLHADLYRLADGCALPDEVEDASAEGGLLLLEWPERLHPSRLAAERLDVRLALASEPLKNLDIFGQACERKRSAHLMAHGHAATRLLALARGLFPGSEPQQSQ